MSYVLRYNMSQENIRVSEKQQTILDLLELHTQSIPGLLAPEIHWELIWRI